MGVRVLVVDDDARVRALMRRALAAAGHEVVACEDAQSGLAAICEQIPDVLCLDLQIPGTSGVQIARRVREDLHDMAPPILLVSGALDELPAEDAVLFDATLAKPFKLDALRRQVERLSQTAGKQRKRSGSRLAAVTVPEDDDASAAG